MMHKFLEGDIVALRADVEDTNGMTLLKGSSGQVMEESCIRGGFNVTHVNFGGTYLWCQTSKLSFIQHAVLAQKPVNDSGAAVDYGDLYVQASGTLALVAGWLRGNSDDLHTQAIYDMIAKEQGLEAVEVPTVLASKKLLKQASDKLTELQAENARLRSELEAARGKIDQLRHKITVIYDSLVFKDEVIE